MPLRNIALTIAGFALLGLGIVGVALPVMPTTPFVLLSAICFTGGNEKLAKRISSSKFFGSYIENYRTKRGVQKKEKILALAFLWAGLTISMIISQKPLICVILLIVGACVSAHILLIKTRRDEMPAGTEEAREEDSPDN